MKDREEYLIDYIDKLLDALINKFKAVNKLFFMVYGLAMLFIFLVWNTVKQISFLGATLEIKDTNLFLIIVMAVCGTYFLINYNFIRIARITRDINLTSDELVIINQNARPVSTKDLQHFEEGLTGLVISLARWQAFRLVNRKEGDLLPINNRIIRWLFNSFVFYYKIYKWALQIVVRPILISSIYYSPLLIIAYFISVSYDIGKTIPLSVFILVIMMTVSTIIYSFILFMSYFYDYVMDLKKELVEGAKHLVEDFVKAENLSITTNVINNFYGLFRLLLKSF